MAHVERRGLVCTPDRWEPLWQSHAMAPAPLPLPDGRVRVYVGGWDAEGISRVWWIDVDGDDPFRMVGRATQPVVDIGEAGTFDENGVFPGHVSTHDGRAYLTTTGFQLGHRVRHYNFGGLTVSDDGGETFARVSRAPTLDRADEGLHVRAGQSLLWEDGLLRSVYAAGTGWVEVGGTLRPVYDVRYQELERPERAGPDGKRIVARDPAVEHALGRPQLLRHRGRLLVLYTRRMLDMRYGMGGAILEEGRWVRRDEELAVPRSPSGFDAEMAYFPGAISWRDRLLVFYSGNGYGRGGLGAAVLDI